MRETAISVVVAVACIAFETFLISIGWNLSIHRLTGLPQAGLWESFGLLALIKIAGINLMPASRIRKAVA